MALASIEDLQVDPFLDLEEFMNFSKETRLAGDTFERLQELWDCWRILLKAKNLKLDKKSMLAVWLPEEVENAVDRAWEDSPGKGYLFHNLAQYLCMNVIQELIPQTMEGACAPAPDIDPESEETLVKEGFINEKNGLPARRYGVLTYYPFKGGCEICKVREQCPKGGGEEQTASIVLPGYERGVKGDDAD